MDANGATLEQLTLAGYVGALALAFLYGGMQLRRIAPWVLGFLGAGFLLHTALLTRLWAERGTIPAATLGELFGAQAWMLAFLYLLLFVRLRNTIMTFFLTPVVTVSYFLYTLLPHTQVEEKAFFFTPWFILHILLLLSGMSFFLLSFLYATAFIMQDHRLRHQRSPSRLPLPSLEESVKWASRFLVLGYPLFTVGIFSSLLYGLRYGTGRDWRPGLMEGACVAVWIVLGVAIWGWFSAKVQPRKRSWLIVAGAAFTVLIILGILWH